MKLLNIITISLLFFSSAYAQQDTPNLAEPSKETLQQMYEKRLSELKFETGEIKLSNGIANFRLPDGYLWLGQKDARTVITEIWGNPEDSATSVLGMIFPRGQDLHNPDSWAVAVTWEADGYVSDEDANDIDYNELLQTMKEDSREASKQREAEGYGKLELVGWALPPHYDKSKKVMHWAKELDSGSGENTLNYGIRVLGRRGVLVLDAIASMKQVKEVEALTPELLALTSFNSGHRYEEFDASTDKKSDYTLAGLVLGGAVGAKLLAKGGILVLLAKFSKLLIIPIIAGGAWLKNKLTKKAA
jgi:uncharacterized membrane-anchored protein